jgi:hypothetical protein
MKLKRNKTARWLRKRKRAVKGGLAKLVALTGNGVDSATTGSEHALAPTQLNNDNSGILRHDAAAFRLPNALAEVGEREQRDWMPSGFAIFVTILAILFIAIIAWQVSRMPEPK